MAEDKMKLIINRCQTEDEIKSIYHYDADVFTESVDFDWSIFKIDLFKRLLLKFLGLHDSNLQFH